MKKKWFLSILITMSILGTGIFGIFSINVAKLQQTGTVASGLVSVDLEDDPSQSTLDEKQDKTLKDIIKDNEKKVVYIEGTYGGGQGSGFLYNDKGDIITNAHVVEGEETVLIRLFDTTTYYGTVIGIHKNIDVAVVRVPELAGREPMNLAHDFYGEVGDQVIAMGSPRGYQNTVTTGIVSAVNRDFQLHPYNYKDAYQISAPIAPGSSGGPLVLVETGEVIAINSARYNGEIIGFSIPISNIWSIVNSWSQEAKHVEGGTSPSVNYNSSWFNEKEAAYIVYYLYENINDGNFVEAYRLWGSQWQSNTTYEKFREGYLNTLSVYVIDIDVKKVDNVVKATVIIEADEQKDGTYGTSRYEMKYDIAIENDQMKIIKGQGKKL